MNNFIRILLIFHSDASLWVRKTEDKNRDAFCKPNAPPRGGPRFCIASALEQS
jgi:hypothetical protein